MIKVPLTQGKFALIDAKDGPRVLRYKWTLMFNRRSGKFYARRTIRDTDKQRTVYLHRFILDAPLTRQVDHRNGDGLDCRRRNLRLATNAQNHQNMKCASHNRSGFKGVCVDSRPGRRPTARIFAEGKRHFLGAFDSAEAAARAYDRKAKQFFGEFARLNFPEERRNV